MSVEKWEKKYDSEKETGHVGMFVLKCVYEHGKMRKKVWQCGGKVKAGERERKQRQWDRDSKTETET